MKIKFTFSLAVFLLFQMVLVAQPNHPTCGTVGDIQEQLIGRLTDNIATLRSAPLVQRDVVYIPWTVHVVRRNNGTGGVSEKAVFEQLCEMNHSYESVGMVFYIKQFNYVDNSVIFDEHSGAAFLMTAMKDQSSINIWCVNDATPLGGSGLGVTLGYFSTSSDWIVMLNDEFGRNKKTLPHEVGHFFSLAHPHRGWDSENYNAAMHGNPVQAISPGGIPTELQDGTNCTVAGDLICDTPPDYNFGFGWNNCNYNFGTMDPNGEVVDPQEDNMMAYFLHCPADSYHFTDMQKEVMLIDYNTVYRAYLRDLPIPSHDDITDGPELLFPIDGESTALYNTVNFEWGTADGATYYYLEISDASNFDSGDFYEAYIVYGNSKSISADFVSGTKYYWTVRGMNGTQTCEGLSGIADFRTGTSVPTHEIEAIEALQIYPNPAFSVSEIMVQMETNSAFSSTIQLFDITGKQVGNILSYDFESGHSELSFPIKELQSGIYNLTITSAGEAISRKVVIIK